MQLGQRQLITLHWCGRIYGQEKSGLLKIHLFHSSILSKRLHRYLAYTDLRCYVIVATNIGLLLQENRQERYHSAQRMFHKVIKLNVLLHVPISGIFKNVTEHLSVSSSVRHLVLMPTPVARFS
jgi:hypothetical protein